MRSPLAVRHLGLLVLVASGCVYGNKSTPDGGPPPSSTATTATTGRATSSATAASSSSAAANTASSASSSSSSAAASSGSSGSSSAAATTASTASSSSSSSSSSGSSSSSSSSGSSSSSSSSSSGSTLTFVQLCAQAVDPLCAYYATCEIGDVDAGDCATGVDSLIGCTPTGNAAAVSAGLLAFDPVAGQACLDALEAPGDCGAATDAVIAAACASLLQPQVARGGTCTADIDCLPPADAGYGDFGYLYGCDLGYDQSQLVCEGVCSYGHLLGESCGSPSNGSGCAEGNCIYQPFDDGGYGYLCTQPPAGASCAFSDSCGDGQTCASVEDAGYVCVVPGGPGTACDYSASENGTGVCNSATYCSPPSDGGIDGSCLALGIDAGPCYQPACEGYGEINCSCDPHSYCRSGDGGAGVCSLLGGIGTPCTEQWCTGLLGCACATGLQCAPSTDGGSQAFCAALGGVGAPCNPNNCEPPTTTGCACDAAQSLYCDSLSQTCQTQLPADAGCNPSDAFACGPGLACGDDICIPQNPVLGQLCAPNNDIDCAGSNICTNMALGTCVAPSTLGETCGLQSFPSPCGADYQCLDNGNDAGTCQPYPTAGQLCSSSDYTCRALDVCNYAQTSDGGGYVYACEAQHDLGGSCDPSNSSTCIEGFCDPTTSLCRDYLSPGDFCTAYGFSACGPYGGCNTYLTDGGYLCDLQCYPEE